MAYSSPPPNICHDPLRPNGLAGISPSHKITYKGGGGWLTPCVSPCNSPNLPVKKPNGKGWRFAQDIGAINKEIL